MKKSNQKSTHDDVDFSPISCLPDEVVLEIFNKVMDLKMLCICEVVSKRFYAIVHQVDTIRAFRSVKDPTKRGGWLMSMSKFKTVKSICIQIPYNNEDDNSYLFKWKVKMGLNGIDSIVIVSPTSIYDKNNKGLLLYERKHKMEIPRKFSIALGCLVDALSRLMVLWHITNINIPLLEKVSITDSGNRGRVSVNGREKIDELRNLKSINNYFLDSRMSECYLPLLDLPVSGYVMKGVTLVLVENKDLPDDRRNYDRFINDEIDFKHDKEEAAYHEAMMEIFKKVHKGSIMRRSL